MRVRLQEKDRGCAREDIYHEGAYEFSLRHDVTRARLCSLIMVINTQPCTCLHYTLIISSVFVLIKEGSEQFG